MKIISNTGPIIGLAKIGQLCLLKAITPEVLIPPMVHRELLSKIGRESEEIENALNEFLRVTKPKPLDSSIEMLIAHLDEGEKQAVNLALNHSSGCLLLLDDRAGRKVSRRLGVPTTGVVGIVLLAKEKGLIQNVGTLLTLLRNQGYWLSNEIVQTAKQLAGE